MLLICGSNCFSWGDLFRVVQRQLYHLPKDPIYNRYDSERLLSDKFTPTLKYQTGNRASEAQILTEIRLRTNPNVLERRFVIEIQNKQDIKQEKSKIGLPLLLSYTWNFQATDPRDKLFALKSFVNPEDRPKIVVDYFRSVKDVFTTIAPIFLKGSDQEVLRDLLTGEGEGLEPLEGFVYFSYCSLSLLE